MTAQEFFIKYPGYAADYQEYNRVNKKKLSADDYLKLRFERNPQDPLAAELNPGVFADANTRSSQQGEASGEFQSENESSQTQNTVQTQSGTQNTAGTETSSQTGLQQSQQNALTQQQGQTTEQGVQQTNQNTTTANQGVENSLTQGLVQEQGSQTQNTSGTTSQVGAQTGQEQTTSTGTTSVVDTLGLGKLLQQQAGAATGADATRSAFLTDLVNNGGAGLQDNITKAVNYSLSGPGMVGTGNGAKGRVAGSAVADVVRNDTAQRLAASEQLAGPSATTSLVNAGNAYLGQQQQNQTLNISDLVSRITGQNQQQTTGTNQNTTASQQQGQTNTSNVGQQNTSGVTTNANTTNSNNVTNQNTTGSVATQNQGQTDTTGTSDTNQSTVSISELLSKELSKGTSSGASSSSGFGQQPTQEGGCYVSSVYGLRGLIGLRVIRHCVRYKLSQRRFRYMLWGYSVYGHFLARWMDRLAERGVPVLLPVCRAILYQELRWSGKKLPFKLLPAVYHAVFHYGSSVVGFLSGRRKVTTVVSVLSKKLSASNLLFPENF